MRISFKLLIFTIFNLLFKEVIAQVPTWTIQGRVVTSSVSSSLFCTVSIPKLGKIVLADDKGTFSFSDTVTAEVNLRCSMPGFADIDTQLRVVPGEAYLLLLRLQRTAIEMPQVEVFSVRENALRMLPGSATLITSEQLENIQAQNANEVLRRAPGIHAVDEEGLGLRPNIGFRGLDPDRSRYVLVMEDGVPVSLSPYGEPELYYAPSIDRMQQVEILRGPASIQYGPRTVAGVINYRTADPPATPKGLIQFTGGSGGYLSTRAGFGTTMGRTGIQLDYLRKQSDDFGMLRLRMNDLVLRLRRAISSHTVVGLKASAYNEVSNANYIGMTQPMFEQGGNDFTRLAPEDRFLVRRYALSATLSTILTDQLKLDVLLFGYSTRRDWCRQDFAYNQLDTAGNLLPPPADYSGVTWGDESVAGGALYMRNSTGNRNRTFGVAGADIRIRYDFRWMGTTHQAVAGVKVVAERAHEVRINGTMPGDLGGSVTDEEFRPVTGLSAFVCDKWPLTERLEMSPGVRWESMVYTREIMRGRYVLDGVTSVRDTLIRNTSSLTAFIPGIGFSYRLGVPWTMFGGVHRGFAPPRIKDAITADGTDQQLDAELSWNYEWGIRANGKRYWQAEITAFCLDFENQVIPVSESSGGAGTGLMNGGSTLSRGLELSTAFTTENEGKHKWNAGCQLTVTYTRASFSSDRILGSGENRVNISGNRLPYAPEWQGTGTFTLQSVAGFTFNVSAHYTGAQYTDILNTQTATANGLTGRLSPFRSYDAGCLYRSAKTGLTLSASVKNLSNERYIFTRRPQGIRVSLPRMFFVGIKKEF
jgi:Fe(3+) dicitrate transport protein